MAVFLEWTFPKSQFRLVLARKLEPDRLRLLAAHQHADVCAKLADLLSSQVAFHPEGLALILRAPHGLSPRVPHQGIVFVVVFDKLLSTPLLL
jgi:hypothetical protein